MKMKVGGSITLWLLALKFVYLIQNGYGYMVGRNPHHRRVTIDTLGRYQLEWVVNLKNKVITFNVTVETTGYIGLGLSPNGKMTGADIVIGGVDFKGRTYFADYHAVGHLTPVRDPSQDWQLLSGQENGTHTFLSFSRPFDTCDPQDYAITEDRIAVIWSFGARDEIRYHHGNRGMFHVYLLNPDYSPEIITEPKTGVQHVLTEDGNVDTSVQVWTINRVMAIPGKETTYWCTMHKAPPLQRKNHLVGFDVRLHSDATVRHVHHFVVFRCHAPSGVRDARSMFDHFIGTAGEECMNIRMPSGQMPTEYCTEFMYTWTVGSRAYFHPPHVGFPFDSEAYYMTQLHVDNPTLISNTRVSLSVDMFYTENVKENEGGFFTISHEIPGLPPSLLIPPHTLNGHIRGICGATCIRDILPAEGISVYATHLHTHRAGKKVRLRHFRNSLELPFISADENYSFFFQHFRNLQTERRILPGDELIAECVYDSTNINETIVGGIGTRQEMCSVILLHYQKLRDIQACDSQIVSKWGRQYFLAGVDNMTWSASHNEFVVNPPHPLAGQTISQVSNNHVNWTLEMREDLERYHLHSPHVNRCPAGLWAASSSMVEHLGEPVTYPFRAIPYKPDKPCAFESV